jgi:hypothetical protein
MYTTVNYRSKKELKLAVRDGEKVTYYQPGPFGGSVPRNGTITLEGPHYPEAHKWYAQAKVENDVIVKVS